jgi:hypothetical protein
VTDRILSIGECMVELAPLGEGTCRQGFAGDTFNMASYLARLLTADWQVDYLTAVGDDAMSARMIGVMQTQGIGTHHVAIRPGGRRGPISSRSKMGSAAFPNGGHSRPHGRWRRTVPPWQPVGLGARDWVWTGVISRGSVMRKGWSD